MMKKTKLYLVSYEVNEYGQELVRAHSKKEAIKKVQNKSSDAQYCGTSFTAEVCEDQEEDETI